MKPLFYAAVVAAFFVLASTGANAGWEWLVTGGDEFGCGQTIELVYVEND